MPVVPVYDKTKKKVGDLNLDDRVEEPSLLDKKERGVLVKGQHEILIKSVVVLHLVLNPKNISMVFLKKHGREHSERHSVCNVVNMRSLF